MEIQELIKAARKASLNAYAPYSSYSVGAVVLVANGQLIQGCNIENAAYGSTMCAERNAVFQTYCQGYRKDDIQSLTIYVSGKLPASPCGACRQVLVELLDQETPIILACDEGYHITSIKELLPGAFVNENMINQ